MQQYKFLKHISENITQTGLLKNIQSDLYFENLNTKKIYS